MNNDNTRLIYSSSFFLLVFVLVVVSKPDFVFDKQGRLKELGTGPSPEKTMLPLGIVTLMLAIVCFYVFCFMDIAFGSFVYKANM